MKSLAQLKIVFFGTPDFAVASLAALREAQLNVVAVVTAPDKPAGRGLHMQGTPVKLYAEQHQIPVLQPHKLKDPEFVAQLQALQADIHIVVAFRMLPEVVWNMPPMGTLNVHGSLLPQYRGAAPINWAIIHGARKTGVTTFRLKHEIDTGNILLKAEVPILPEDNAGSVHDKLMHAGAALLVETLKGLVAGTVQEIPQDSIVETLRHAPKLFKEHMQIDWNMDANAILCLIRGLSPYPAAFTHLDGKVLKVFTAHIVAEQPGQAPGFWDTDHKSYLRFATKDAWLYLDELQLEGKKKMFVQDFLRGYRFKP
jgi:methionyl-tRNA formyltransferase